MYGLVQALYDAGGVFELAIKEPKSSSGVSWLSTAWLGVDQNPWVKTLSYQDLIKRPHKNVAMSDIKVDVCVFAFDLLYLNGQALLQENLKIRRERRRENRLKETCQCTKQKSKEKR